MIDWGNLASLMGLTGLKDFLEQYASVITRRKTTQHPGSKKNKAKTKSVRRIRDKMAKESRRKNRGK